MAGIPMRKVEWQPLRDAYVQRTTRPTYDELAVEYAVPAPAIGRCASDEGWPALRARYLDSQLVAADASGVLLAAVRADRTILTGVTSMAIVTIASLTRCVESIDDERAPQTKAQALNTCTFALKNLTDALKNVGLIGVAKTLDDEGKSANGRWDPKMLTQINVTMQGLVAGAAQVTASQARRPDDPPAASAMTMPIDPVPSGPMSGAAPGPEIP